MRLNKCSLTHLFYQSSASGGNYAGLSNLKRNSQDGKLASFMEQKPGGNTMWDKMMGRG
jgi:hypothetical protein